MNKRSIGYHYEEKALQYLEEKGYKIICRNYYSRFGEIDLIVLKNQTYIFVEVKYRENNNNGRPYEAVNYRKQQRIMKTAVSYIKKENLFNHSFRFDIIEILGDQLFHYENAFQMNRRYWS